MKINFFAAILVLTILGGFLRFYNIEKNPVSLNVDEVSIGYNAYSILLTGKDEYRISLPLTIKSLGDYKPPLYVYLSTIPIYFFGLNEFSVRFISSLFGTLAIPLSFILFLYLIKNKNAALLGTALLTISPWHIYFSRLASESITALTLVILGTICLFRTINGKWIWGFLASVFLIASMFTYHAERIFVPLFIFTFMILHYKNILQKKKNWIIFTTIFGILLLPLVYLMLFGPDRTRAQMTIISNDVEFLRVVTLDSFGKYVFDFLLIIFFGIRKYLAYFQPSFLFYNGLGMTKQGTYGLGVMYLFEIPFLFAGIIALARKKIINRPLILFWVFLGIFPAALTLNEQHPIRTMVILPMVILISAIGAIDIISLIEKHFSTIQKIFTYSIFSIVIIWNFLLATIIFSIHFPKEKSEGLMEGTKQAVEYLLLNQDKYKEIVFDPVRGIEGPYLVSVPHLYILFYSKYDPNKYHQIEKRQGKNFFGFDKFTIRSINWREDYNKSDVLFIGSPWSIPQEQLAGSEILKRIYLSNGKLALLIVSPKKQVN